MKFHTQLKANDIFKFSLAYPYSGFQLILTIAMIALGIYMCITGTGAADGQSNICLLYTSCGILDGEVKNLC